MNALRLAGLSLLILAALPTNAAPLRYPVQPNGAGWVQLELTPELQRASAHLWLSDESGAPVPFLRDAPDRYTPTPQRIDAPLIGRNEAGLPTIEFDLSRVPAPRGPFHTLQLEFAPGTDWAARPQISRRVGDGAWLTDDASPNEALYSFNQNNHRSIISLPTDGQRYRISLAAIAGIIPTLRGASLLLDDAEPRSPRREPTTVRPEPGSAGAWRISTPAAVRLQAIELMVDGTFAPITCEVRVPPASPTPNAPALVPLPLAQAVIWHLPALATRQLTLQPHGYPTVNEVVITLPNHVRLNDARFLALEERWLFPAEAHRTYYLHTGSPRRLAAGDLASLARPTATSLPLASIGAPVPDPNAETPASSPISWAAVARFLPWFVTSMVALVGWAALRLLRKQK